jgi:hypothetical protein
MNTTKTQTINVTINDVVFTIDIDAAIKAGIVKTVTTHKIGNYYRHPQSGTIFILVSYGGLSRVSLVPLTGAGAGYRYQTIDLPNINKITEAEFTYVASGMTLEQIDNPLVK